MRGKVVLKIFSVFLSLLPLLFFAACSQSVVAEKICEVKVVLVENDAFEADRYVYDVGRGEDLAVDITVKPGYGLVSCDYFGEYSVVGNTDRVKIRLQEIKFDARITLKTQRVTAGICYYLNGGEFAEEDESDRDYFIEYADTTRHLRANTNIGTGVINREGYTQIGWNTAADGSGEHIGLGSRVTAENDTMTYLYAEWVKWTDPAYFSYADNDDTPDPDDIELTLYAGGRETPRLVVPAELDGRRVTKINSGFAPDLKTDALIFPNTLVSVEKKAFERSRIDAIYFFDNITAIYDKSFGNRIPKIHINAVLAPRYTTANDNAQFAEDMDRLILNADRQKMVFFGGCSMSYGLDSPQVEEAFDGEYVVCNMGVIGGTNATFQLDCITAYMGENDIFVHAPEQLSEYQLLYNVAAESRIFVCTEANYDLLAIADMSEGIGFFNYFTSFNAGRMTEKPLDYFAYNDHYNAYGDMIIARPNSAANTYFDRRRWFGLEYINDISVGRMNEYYGRIADRGARVYFSFAPVNRNALPEEDKVSRIWILFADMLSQRLESRFTIISNAFDYIMEGRYFYDTDYHLSSEGAKERTKLLIRDIKAAMSAANEND